MSVSLTESDCHRRAEKGRALLFSRSIKSAYTRTKFEDSVYKNMLAGRLDNMPISRAHILEMGESEDASLGLALDSQPDLSELSAQLSAILSLLQKQT